MNNKNIALLIDAENVSSRYLKCMFDELSVFGNVSVRRVYGNWAKMKGWDEHTMLEYSLQPVQQFNYTSGKNSADISMVIDAMDILYTNKVDVFCLVTSDSDFTRLAMRLREAQAYVICMGESKTPNSLIKACNKFVNLSLLYTAYAPVPVPVAVPAVIPVENVVEQVSVPEKVVVKSGKASLVEVKETVIKLVSENEGASITEINAQIRKQYPNFTATKYGYKTFKSFISSEIPEVESHVKNNVSMLVLKKQDITAEDTANANIIPLSEIKSAIIKSITNSLKVPIALMGTSLKQLYPAYKVKDYGYSKLKDLILAELPEIAVNKINGIDMLEFAAAEDKQTAVPLSDIKNLVMDEVAKAGNIRIDVLVTTIRKTYPTFKFKDYGYTLAKNFIISEFPEILTEQQNSTLMLSVKENADNILVDEVTDVIFENENAENAENAVKQDVENIPEPAAAPKQTKKPAEEKEVPLAKIKKAVLSIVKKAGTLNMDRLIPVLREQYPNFKLKDYGYSTSKKFVKDEFPEILLEQVDGVYTLTVVKKKKSKA